MPKKRKQKPRKYYKYQFRIGNKIVHGGITIDLSRREAEHKANYGQAGKISQVGRRTNEDAARAWEKKKGYQANAKK